MSSQINKTYLWFAGFLAAAALAMADVKVGGPFPDLAAFGLEGQLPDHAGKVVLVDIWASWCGPCKESFPAYSELQRELAPRGFMVIAVSVDKVKAPYDEFVKRFSPAFATVRDGKQKLVASVRPPSMPTGFLIDRRGVLRSVHSGYHGAAGIQALKEEITKLLEEKL